MTKIEYIKNAPLAKVGDVASVSDSEAKVLIKLGFAKLHDEPKPKKRKTTNE